jgi:hypothetical protein
MSELLSSNSGSFYVKNKIRGGAEIPIGPKLDINSVPLDPKPVPPSTSLDMMANESFNTPKFVEKIMNYGSPIDTSLIQFSYGQTNKILPLIGTSGGMRKQKVKAIQRVKKMQKQNKPEQKRSKK